MIPLPFFQPSNERLIITVARVVLALPVSQSQEKVKRWIAEVDLAEGKVMNVVEYS